MTYTYQSMKKTLFAIILLIIFLSHVQSQNFIGGRPKHMETGIFTASPIDSDTVERPVLTFSTLLSRSDAFDDSDKDIFIGTSIRDYSFNTMLTSGNLDELIHIEVQNPHLNPGKNILTVTIITEGAFVNNAQTRAKIFAVRLNYIIVGSGFEGHYPSLQSSYVFARNGNMDLYSGATGIANQPYDFHNPKEPSPFNYQYVPTTHLGCGVVKRDGKWIIQYGTQCRYIQLSVFITGFELLNNPQGVLAGGHINFKGQYIAGEQNDFANENLSPDNTRDGMRLFDTIPAGFLNLPPNVIPSVLKRLQLSLVTFALREFNFDSYPIQLINPNTFKVNLIDGNNLDFYGTPSTPGLPAGTYPSGWSDLATLEVFLQPSETKIVSIPNYATRMEDIGLHHLMTNDQVAHLFCGDHVSYIAHLPTIIPPLVALLFPPGGDVTQKQRIDLNVGTINTDWRSGFRQALSIKKGPNVPHLILVKSQNCVMFSSTSDNICEEKSSSLRIDTSTAFSAVATPAGNTGTDFLTSLPNPSFVYGPTQDSHYIEDLPDMLTIQQTFGKSGTIQYKFAYEGVEANKPYEGVLHIATDSIPMTDTNGYYRMSITISVFGNLVYRETQTLSQNAKTIHFSFLNKVNNGSQVIITYQTHFNGKTVSFKNFLQFGIIEHNAVLNEKGECSATCDPIDNKSLGINYATVPPTCVSCDTTLNIIFRPDIGRCGCGDGFVSINGICEVCGINLCSRCSTDKGKCQMCTSNSEFVNTTDSSKGCKCNTNYYKSDLVCKMCPDGCVDCTSPTSCTTCVVNKDTRTSNDTGCACKPGFYETGAAICPKCAPQCKTCSKVSTNCTSCATENRFEPQGTTCLCQQGYFKVIKKDDSATCEPCASYCAKCTDKADNCAECKPFRVRGSDNKCVCQSGYLQFQGECIDTLCSAIPFCQSCSILLTDGSSICNTCAGDRVPSDDKKVCECKAGYYKKGDKCEKCGSGCKKCESQSVCKNCADQAYQLGDGTCQCPLSNFIAHVDNHLICQLCDANCRTCEGSPSNCSECQNGFVSVSNKCVCPTGYYPTLDRFQCLSCGTGCSSCTTGAKCDICEPGYTSSSSRCVLNCPTGSFNAGDQCKKCSNFCSHCTSSISCNGCFTNYYLFAGSCRSSCPDGTFARGSLCLACKQPCKTCNVNADSCLTCIEGYFVHNGQCVSDCPAKHYYDGTTCKPCSSNCENCFKSANNCITCPDKQYLVNSQCQSSCPHTIVDGKCTDNCPSSYYLSGNTCRKCQGNCETCSSATKCLTCKNSMLVYNGGCVSSCPDNTMQMGDFCVDCDPSCIGCSQNPFSCYKCRNGYYQLEERCYRQCPDGFYPDNSMKTCKQCDAGCEMCRGPGQCSKCKNNMSPMSGICSDSCGKNCLKCVNKVCQRCSEGYIISEGKCQSFCPPGSTVQGGSCVCNTGFLHNNRCISSCPSGFVGEGKNCVACRQPCKTCVGSAVQCASCQQGFKLDQVTQKCISNVDCPYGYYASNFGGCRLICQDGWYFHDSACYQNGCPIGYSPQQESRSCTQEDVPSGCSFPYYLQGSTCVSNCGPGFFANPANRVCEPCPSNCYTCTADKVCQGCVAGFIPSGNVCVSSVDCPTDYYKYEERCVRNCPVGTSPQNGYCVRTCRAGSYFYISGCYLMCPTRYQTKEACVEVCPPNYVLENNTCISPSKQCPQSQYYDSNSNNCFNCRVPCASCQGAANRCTSCINNYYLSNFACLPNSGLSCPEKCGSCSEPNKCSTCASGYVNTGSDCVKNTNVLKSVSFQEISKSIRGRTVFIRIKPSVIPNNLPSSVASNFFIFSPSQSVDSILNQWVSGADIYVAITHTSNVPKYTAFLIPNSEILNTFYLNMGYKLVDSYVQVEISQNLQTAPASLNIPASSSAVSSQKNNQSLMNYAMTLNSVVQRAIRFV